MRSHNTAVARAVVSLVNGLILLLSLAGSSVGASSFLLWPTTLQHHTPRSSSSIGTSQTPSRRQWTSPPCPTPQHRPLLLHSTKRRTTALQAVPPVAGAVLILPSLPSVALACLIPTSLGFYKYEYAVSYGYGLSVATVAGLVLQPQLRHTNTVAVAHASALVFYGLRLCLFLWYRERSIPRFREMRERIEARRRRDMAARVPFVLGCATLYAGLAAPLWVTTTTTIATNSGTTSMAVAALLLNASVALTWVGFLVAAWGDFQKSWVKARKGDDALVQGGIFALLRHPNYTGEAVGWTASFLASVIAAVVSWDAKFIVPLAASFFGWIGIVGVLAMATSGLEKRQKEKYGTNPEYDEWMRKSWAGPTLPRK